MNVALFANVTNVITIPEDVNIVSSVATAVKIYDNIVHVVYVKTDNLVSVNYVFLTTAIITYANVIIGASVTTYLVIQYLLMLLCIGESVTTAILVYV